MELRSRDLRFRLNILVTVPDRRFCILPIASPQGLIIPLIGHARFDHLLQLWSPDLSIEKGHFSLCCETNPWGDIFTLYDSPFLQQPFIPWFSIHQGSFQSGCAILFSPQQCLRVQVVPHFCQHLVLSVFFLILAILMDAW